MSTTTVTNPWDGSSYNYDTGWSHELSDTEAAQYGADLAKAEYDYKFAKEKEYNLMVSDPSWQMERYKAAGLNPNLVYAQQQKVANQSPSTGSTNVQGSRTQAQANRMNAFLNTINAFNDIAGSIVNNINETRMTNSQVALNGANLTGVQGRNEGIKYQNQILRENAAHNEDYLTTRNAIQQNQLTEQDNLAEYNRQVRPYQIEQIKATSMGAKARENFRSKFGFYPEDTSQAIFLKLLDKIDNLFDNKVSKWFDF